MRIRPGFIADWDILYPSSQDQGHVGAMPKLSDKVDPSGVSEYSRCRSGHNRDSPYRGCPFHDSPSRDCLFSNNRLFAYLAGQVAEVPFEEQQERPEALLTVVDLVQLLTLLPCLHPWRRLFLQTQSAHPEFGVLRASYSGLLVPSR